jgi:hypothetical protein
MEADQPVVLTSQQEVLRELKLNLLVLLLLLRAGCLLLLLLLLLNNSNNIEAAE